MALAWNFPLLLEPTPRNERDDPRGNSRAFVTISVMAGEEETLNTLEETATVMSWDTDGIPLLRDSRANVEKSPCTRDPAAL